MIGGKTRATHGPSFTVVLVLLAGSALAGGCALTHEQAPAIQELALEYSPPELGVKTPVEAAIKVRRFSGLSPYDGTTMYYKRGGYRMNSFNYERWVASPASQVTGLLYRDLAATHVFQAVFPYLSPEQARFQLEGTVVECVMTENGGAWEARLVISVSLIDTGAPEGDRRVVLQREFEATQALQGGSAEQYAAGISAAMKTASKAILRAVYDQCRAGAS